MWKCFLEKATEKSRTKEIEFYMHNLNFGGFLLIDFLKYSNLRFHWFIRDLELYWIEISYLDVSIRIRCSFKLVFLSVEDLSIVMGLQKPVFPEKFININNLQYKGPIPDEKFFRSLSDYNLFKKNNLFFDLQKSTIIYSFENIEIIFRLLKKIIKILDSYNKKIIKTSFSFSSVSYKLYMGYFDNYGIKKIYLTENEFNFFRNAYYGGRCEVFGNPSDNKIIHYFDFKGMYAQCMLEKFPIGVAILKEGNLNVNEIGFHTIKFKSNSYLPFLPIKANGLIFPNGTLTGTYWYEEILNAVNKGKCEIIEHYSSYVYKNEDFVFKKFSQEFTALRERGAYFNLFGKNMINGLYGSFALREENSINIITTDEMEFKSILDLMDILKWKKIENLYIIDIVKNKKSSTYFDKEKRWKNNSKRNIAYAAIISAKARIKLNKALSDVLENNGELYYTDTDSILAGFDSNSLGKQLGEIKWSHVFDDGVFIRNKFYYLKNNESTIRDVNFRDYDFSTLKKKFYDNELYLNFKDGIIDDDVFTINQISYLKKNMDPCSYEKRKFSKDKKFTYPINIDRL